MTKPKKTAKISPGGPYLAAAVFCDSVIRSEDGTMTAVRMVDHMTITIPGNAPPDVPSTDKMLLGEIAALIGFKKGSAGTKHSIKLAISSPSGKSNVVLEKDAEFRGEAHGGFNLNLQVKFEISEAGLFWMDVFLDGTLMTRMPLMVTVKRADLPPVVKKPAVPTAKKKPASSVRSGKRR